ncbi:hypothetical protein KM043_018574 [Ampulex compressa]|nr:hypothetical protein KM043_018574 [Ampulex compressa]
METRILVCLLITLCGLAKVHTEKKEANLEPDKFDPAHAMQDVNDKLQTLLVDNVLEWQQTYIYSYLIRNISNNLLSTKLKQEHDLVQIAVEVARKKGKEKAHCLEENKEMLHVFYEDMKAKTNHCIDVSINKYGESYVTTGKVKDIANTVERYLNFDPADFDAEKTLQDTKHKVKELMTNTTKDFQIAHLFLAFTYNDISNRLGMKMTEELDRLHISNTVEKYVSFELVDFDVDKTVQDITHKVKELMASTMIDFQIAHLVLILRRNDVSYGFQRRMSQELDNIRPYNRQLCITRDACCTDKFKLLTNTTHLQDIKKRSMISACSTQGLDKTRRWTVSHCSYLWYEKCVYCTFVHLNSFKE